MDRPTWAAGPEGPHVTVLKSSSCNVINARDDLVVIKQSY